MADVEKTIGGNEKTSVQSSNDIAETPVQHYSDGRMNRWIDSFRRMDISDVDTTGMTEVEVAALKTASAPLKRSLKGRHMQMIAIGGSIGSGLFVGSGGSFASGGSGSVVLGFGLIGIMLFFTVHALGELACRYPVSGAFSTYSVRFVDPSWGFAMGWNYALQWLIVFPLELVAASITISYWKTDGSPAATVNPVAWVALFYVLVCVINIFGVRGYGEAEFIFAIIKVTAVVGFIIMGICVAAGANPKHEYYGGKMWYADGSKPFKHGFKGFASVFVNAAFAFAGTELVGLAAAESSNPRKTLPSATKQVFWRIALFYIVSLIMIGFLVPDTNPLLGTNTSGGDSTASPFVIAIKLAGIKGLPSVMNVVILIAVLSVGNSSVFGCSRTLTALAAQGYAPKIFDYIDRQGRPLVSTLFTLFIGLLCFLAASDKKEDVFNWMLAFSGLSSLFTWGSINLCHIRFRAGLKSQGRGTDELPFTAAGGILGSWIGFLFNVFILCLQFWVALFPIGSSPNASDFFQVYLSAPVVIVMYLGHKIYSYYKKDFVWFIAASKMDLDSGVRDLDTDLLRQELAEERAALKARPIYYRIYKFWC